MNLDPIDEHSLLRHVIWLHYGASARGSIIHSTMPSPVPAEILTWNYSHWGWVVVGVGGGGGAESVHFSENIDIFLGNC